MEFVGSSSPTKKPCDPLLPVWALKSRSSAQREGLLEEGETPDGAIDFGQVP